jgi:hypothetical protein
MHLGAVPGLNIFTQRQARAKYIHERNFLGLKWPDATGGGTRAKYIFTQRQARAKYVHDQDFSGLA